MRHFFIAATLIVLALVFTGLMASALQVLQQHPRLAEEAGSMESAKVYDAAGPSH